MELKLPNGIRQLIFKPIPFTLNARLIGALKLEFLLLGLPKNIKYYICFGEIETFRCVNCLVCAETMCKCGRCDVAVRYCSRKCQVAHWPVHKAFCAEKKE
jgi:hypothetical protein